MKRQDSENRERSVSRRSVLSKSAKCAALVPVSTLIAANAASAHSAPFGGFASHGACVSHVDSQGVKGTNANCRNVHGL